MRRAILLALTAMVLPAAAAPVPKSIRRAHDAELAKLQGTWVLVSREEAGLVTVQDGHTTFVVTGDRWEWKYDGRVIQQGTFKLIDIRSSPKQWEYTVAVGVVGYSIYEVDGDTFRYCSTGSPETRPTEFATATKGGGGYCCVWKRKE